MTFHDLSLGLDVTLKIFLGPSFEGIQFGHQTVQQTQTLVSTKMRAVRAVQSLRYILHCPCLVIGSD